MPAGEGYEDQLVLVEDGPEETPVRKVVAIPLIRVVADDDIPRVEVVAELVEDVLDRELLRQEHGRRPLGHRDGTGLRIPDTRRHVVELGDQVVLRGAVDHMSHLATHALEGVPDGRQGDRVDGVGFHTAPPVTLASVALRARW